MKYSENSTNNCFTNIKQFLFITCSYDKSVTLYISLVYERLKNIIIEL